jgi:2-dehydropantoate 2-reductase
MPKSAEPHLESWEPRRVAIIGAGAMGTSLAAIIGQHVPVVMVCRNPTRAAQLFQDDAHTQGLLTCQARPIIVKNCSGLTSIGGVSVIFVATKTTAIPQIADELKPILPTIGDQPQGVFVVSYQNGIEPGRQLLEMLEWPQVLRMVLNFGAVLHPQDTSVRVTFNDPPHVIGGADQQYASVCEKIASLLTHGGLATEYVSSIEPLVWAKGIANAAVNPVAALVNSTVNQVMNSPASRIVEMLLNEGIAVAHAEGIELDPKYPEKVRALIQSAGQHTPSMVEDIRAGRESEIGQLNQQIIAYARKLSIPVPTHDIIDALIETFDWKVYHHQKPAITP